MKEVFGEGKDLVSGGEEKRRMKSRIIFCETDELLRVVWVAGHRRLYMLSKRI